MLRYVTNYSLRPLASLAASVTPVVLLTALLVGTVQAQDEMDPWEGYNRWMFEFNDASDRILIKPVARGYDAIMPEPARIGVNNFFSNFYDFNGVLKALLQGRIEEAFNNTFRVISALACSTPRRSSREIATYSIETSIFRTAPCWNLMVR